MALETPWDRHGILAEIKRRGMTLTRLAQVYGLEPSSTAIALKRGHRRAERAIADFLGVPLKTLWPDRYRDSSVTHSAEVSPRRRRRTSQNGTAIPDGRAAA